MAKAFLVELISMHIAIPLVLLILHLANLFKNFKGCGIQCHSDLCIPLSWTAIPLTVCATTVTYNI